MYTIYNVYCIVYIWSDGRVITITQWNIMLIIGVKYIVPVKSACFLRTISTVTMTTDLFWIIAHSGRCGKLPPIYFYQQRISVKHSSGTTVFLVSRNVIMILKSVNILVLMISFIF